MREYCSYRFEDICATINFKNSYQRNDHVMKTIGNFREDNKILSRYRGLYHANKNEFKKVNRLYNKLRKRRNALAHINTTSNFEDIKRDLSDIITKVEELYNSNSLAHIRL